MRGVAKMLEYKQKRNNGRTPFAGVYKFVCVCVCVRVRAYKPTVRFPSCIRALMLTEKNCSISYCTFPNVLFLLPRFCGLYLCQFHAGPYITAPVYISCRQAEYCFLYNLVKQFKQNTERCYVILNTL